MASVTWRTCGDDGHWCSLQDLNLNSIEEKRGVYIIWHEGNPSQVVRVGQGNIGQRLGEHCGDMEITAYASFGKLRVTWASAPEADLDGIERYLADTWPPLVGDAFPDTAPIAVNSPFA
ncbi:MAG: hypothetical protein GY807_04500 [Gammaproteobacteria bacterium]|nr:hypothetical protein [Gammaproteobacteria bacterium]